MAERSSYGWTSNNSVFAEIGMNYSKIAKQISINGEPGILWMDNARKFSRMIDKQDDKDRKASGANPCNEQTLESYELCNLVETFPTKNVDLEDFKRTLKFAYLYAKTTSLGQVHWAESNKVLLRNRRIGTSLSGVAQFVEMHGIHKFKKWCEEGYETLIKYDNLYSDWLAIPKSIKLSTIKPSGTVSLLAGVTPGMHYPESTYYIRRIRFSEKSPLLKGIENAGYKIEKEEVSAPIDLSAIEVEKKGKEEEPAEGEVAA